MSTVTLEKVLACPRLPSLPKVAVRVLELTSCENAQARDIEEVVQQDPALVSRILKTVNSSYYGLSKPCPTIGPAVTYLGPSTVKSLVLGFSLVDLSRRAGRQVDLVGYWRRGLTAAAARRIAASLGTVDPEEAFIAALMQDIGMLAMELAIGPEYGEVLAQAGRDHAKLPELERKAFQFDHSEAGATLGGRWGLPEWLVLPIRRHHARPGAAAPVIARIVSVSAEMAQAITGNPESVNLASLAQAAEGVGLGSDQVRVMLIAISEDLRQLSGLFKVNVGAIPDVAALLDAAEDAAPAPEPRLARSAETVQQRSSDQGKPVLTDGLTKIASRERFDHEIAAGVEQARSCSWSFGLILADVDHFKELNDAHGTQAGDVILVELARRCSEGVGNAGLVCRYGGDELAVLLPGKDRPAATQLAESLRVLVASRPFDIRAAGGPTENVEVTASFGVAVFESDSEGAAVLGDPRILLLAADKTLCAAKGAGRNSVRVFRPRSRASEAGRLAPQSSR